MDDVTFERRVLGRVAAEVSYPPTPSLRAGVLAGIAADAPGARPTWRRTAVLAAAAVVAVAIAVALAMPGSRSAIAEFFGVSGSKVEVLPTPAPGVTPTPFPAPADISSYATPTTLESAQTAAGFAPALPPGEGAPLGAYLVEYGGPPPVVVLQYARFDLWESRTVGFFVKGVPEGVEVRDRSVNGRPATWIGEGEHIVRFVDAQGREVAASVRTVGRGTLIWSTEATFYRLETDLSEEEAVRVAESLP